MAFDPNHSFTDFPILAPSSELHCRTRYWRSSASSGIPNQATLINTVPRLDTQTGPRIENIVPTADRLFSHAKDYQR